MFRVPRPNSTIFRLTLALALLAWTALAFGAPSGTEANHAPAPPSQAQVTNGSPHCHDKTMASAGSHDVAAPAPSTGHGDCCPTACHCLAASTAAMTVPWVFVGFVPSGGHWSAGPKTPVPPASAAPPLRPPIA